MSRTLPTAVTNAIDDAKVALVYLVKIEFDSGDLCYHTGTGSLSYNGDTYIGAGTLGSVDPVSEEQGVTVSSVNLGLSGVTDAIISLLLSEPVLNRPASIYLAMLDSELQFDSAAVFLLFSGRVDTITGEQGANASFNVSVRNRLADWDRVRKVVYSDAEQQALYPGDKGFEFVPQMGQKKLIWPRAAFQPDPRD